MSTAFRRWIPLVVWETARRRPGKAAQTPQQCFAGGYIWAETPEETARVAALIPERPAQIALLACYRPLHRTPWADRLAAHTDGPAWLQRMLDAQVRAPRERRAEEVPRWTPITDATSPSKPRLRQM